LQHRPYVQYPPEALANRVEGDVRLEIEVNADGLVVDARYIDGPLELRRAALRSVLDWHYGSGAVAGRRIVTLGFRLPENRLANGGSEPGTPTSQFTLGVLSRIDIEGLSEQGKQQLIERLPIRLGDPLTVEAMREIKSAVARADEHLVVSIQRGREEGSNETALRIFLKENMAANEPPTFKSAAATAQPKQIKVGAGVMRMKRLESQRPVYPPLARQARVSGTVKLSALLAADGSVQRLDVVEGPPLLIPAALEAVKTWKYEPTLLNGEPVEVRTDIDVNFTLTE
jgi:TonB family protein